MEDICANEAAAWGQARQMEVFYSMKRINSGNSGSAPKDHTSAATAKSVLKSFSRILITVFTILVIAGAAVGVALLSFVLSMRDEEVNVDLKNFKQTFTSYIYKNGAGDDTAHPVEKVSLHAGEERVWVDFDKIPKNMKNAIVAIEDKRFPEHKGVDWIRTIPAALNLFGGSDSFGGSSITQQLIKNITKEDDVSITRKVKEIFRALNLEKKYSKDQILEAYLNCVPFSSGTRGVQAAANLYFDKNIEDCSLAECAAIAGITQNPAKYNPLVHKDNNRARQQVVLNEMLKQGKITDAEYQQAMQDSKNMKFVGKKGGANGDDSAVWDWYTEAVFLDVRQALMEKLSVSKDVAEDMLYSGGLKIYSAEDPDLQAQAQEYILTHDIFGSRTKMQMGLCVVGYDGRVLCTVGSRNQKTANLVTSYAMQEPQQSGSSYKPIGVYAPAMDAGLINYSSLINDQPVDNYANGNPGPRNYSEGNGSGVYHGMVTVQKAVAQSYNAAAVQTLDKLGISNSYHFLTDKLGFGPYLTKEDSTSRSSLALGGQSKGVTVESMAAAYEIFGNGGKYYKPYTFYKVLDHDGKVLIDNTKDAPVQAISPMTASIMNRVLRTVVTEGTGRSASISGWDVVGKTGTSNNYYDSWFVGCTPYATAAVWTGYPTNQSMGSVDYAKKIFKGVMAPYLANKPKKDFDLDSNMVQRQYCVQTGLLATDACGETKTGYYDRNNLPPMCDGSHGNTSSTASRSSSTNANVPASKPSQPSSKAAPQPSQQPTASRATTSNAQSRASAGSKPVPTPSEPAEDD